MPNFSSAGLGDEVFLQILRDEIEDPPIPYVESFTANGTNYIYRLQKFPSWDGDNITTITVGATPQTLVANRGAAVGANKVYLEPDTGALYWDPASPPAASAAVTIVHYQVRWLDRRLLHNLYAGLRAMFPMVWELQFVKLFFQTNVWEYSLNQAPEAQEIRAGLDQPSPTNDFFDPRSRILAVEVQEIPAATERFIPINNWHRTGQATIMLPTSQYYSPGATVRVWYAGPYRSLSDLEPQVQHLPVWYAKGKLLADREIVRARFDQPSTTANEQANPPFTSLNIGKFHLQQFDQELDRLKRPMPMPTVLSTYER